jgi:hypothetical protein
MDPKLQEAVRWVNDRRRAHPDLSMKALLEDAARRFDLPLPSENELRRMFHA